MQIRFNEAIVNVETTDELLNMVSPKIRIIPNFDKNKIQVPSGEVLSAPIQAGFTLEQVGIAPNSTICTQAGLLGGKVHGSLARAGKVKGQTPKVDAEEKKKAKTGRAKRRMQVSITALKFCIQYNDIYSNIYFGYLYLQILLVQQTIRQRCSNIRQEEGTKL